MIKHISIITLFSLFTFAASANAFTITSQLTGDLRATNPDGMIIDVTISVDEINSPNKASWVVDLNSPVAHPNMKLDAFYFNLDPSISSVDISFTNILPNNNLGWYVAPSSGTSGAGFAIDFDYESDKNTGGGPKAADVTNSVNLSFDMIATFVLETSDFLDALTNTGNGGVGSGQLGAHVQSLVQGSGNNTDSGFVLGDYEYDEGGGGGQNVVPEPSTMILLGVGLVGLVVYRRKHH